MLWDMANGVVWTVFVILKDLGSIPVIVVKAITNGILLLMQFTAEVVVTIVRLAFILALCCIVLLLTRPDPQVRVYTENFVTVLVALWREFRRRREIA